MSRPCTWNLPRWSRRTAFRLVFSLHKAESMVRFDLRAARTP
jgi:hypothetical protein